MKRILTIILFIFLAGCASNYVEQKDSQNNEKLTESQARLIAEKFCIKGGEALNSGTYNLDSRTWWFDANLNATREGCDPLCVVSELTKRAQIDWRCTDLSEDEGRNNNFTLGNEQLDITLIEYLQLQRDLTWQTVSNSKSICVFEKLDKNELFPHYLWVRCGEFIKSEGMIEEKSGSSLPIKIDYPNELSFFDVKRFTHEMPGDGSLYVKDIERIFPAELQEKVLEYNSSEINRRIQLLANQ